MNELLTIIGTIASVGSVPLSIFLFLKSKEDKIDRIKREVVRILSHQIGEQRELTTFEIQTVINSKSRESKISITKITVEEIIEDLVADTISNPLLDKTIKENIISELKTIYFKGAMLEAIDTIEIESRKIDNDTNIEEKIKELINNRRLTEQKDNQLKNLSKQKKLSESFASFAAITTLLATVLTLVGKEKYDAFSKPLYDFLQNNDFYVAMTASVAVSIVTGLLLGIRKKIEK